MITPSRVGEGAFSLLYPQLPLALKISLRVVVTKECRQEFDSVPKWFIFKCCSPKHQNIKLEQMLLRKSEGFVVTRQPERGEGCEGSQTLINKVQGLQDRSPGSGFSSLSVRLRECRVFQLQGIFRV